MDFLSKVLDFLSKVLVVLVRLSSFRIRRRIYRIRLFLWKVRYFRYGAFLRRQVGQTGAYIRRHPIRFLLLLLLLGGVLWLWSVLLAAYYRELVVPFLFRAFPRLLLRHPRLRTDYNPDELALLAMVALAFLPLAAFGLGCYYGSALGQNGFVFRFPFSLPLYPLPRLPLLFLTLFIFPTHYYLLKHMVVDQRPQWFFAIVLAYVLLDHYGQLAPLYVTYPDDQFRELNYTFERWEDPEGEEYAILFLQENLRSSISAIGEREVEFRIRQLAPLLDPPEIPTRRDEVLLAHWSALPLPYRLCHLFTRFNGYRHSFKDWEAGLRRLRPYDPWVPQYAPPLAPLEVLLQPLAVEPDWAGGRPEFHPFRLHWKLALPRWRRRSFIRWRNRYLRPRFLRREDMTEEAQHRGCLNISVYLDHLRAKGRLEEAAWVRTRLFHRVRAPNRERYLQLQRQRIRPRTGWTSDGPAPPGWKPLEHRVIIRRNPEDDWP